MNDSIFFAKVLVIQSTPGVMSSVTPLLTIFRCFWILIDHKSQPQSALTNFGNEYQGMVEIPPPDREAAHWRVWLELSKI